MTVRATAVIGYHGCSRATAERLAGGEVFELSHNAWDWLGDGVYFWLDGPDRAQIWAETNCVDPVVVKAELNLSLCLDLTRPSHQTLLRAVHGRLERDAVMNHAHLVGNLDLRGDPYGDRKLRRLDRLVINAACVEIEMAAEAALARGETPILPPFTSVRGVFQEGAPVYPGAGFHHMSHVQAAIRQPSCIANVSIHEA